MDIELSECCKAPVIMTRGYVVDFEFEVAPYSDDPNLLKKLESDYDVAEGSDFFADNVRVYQDCCAKCRKPIREPWIEPSANNRRAARDRREMAEIYTEDNKDVLAKSNIAKADELDQQAAALEALLAERGKLLNAFQYLVKTEGTFRKHSEMIYNIVMAVAALVGFITGFLLRWKSLI